MDILQAALNEKEATAGYREYLHRYPEVSGKEFQTLQFIKDGLNKLKIPWEEVEDAGIVGHIIGRRGKGKTLLLRADIDALPMDEDSENLKGLKKSVSSNPGVCHACGHDAHTAMLLTSAKILNEHRAELNGEILLFFERGEEVGYAVFPMLEWLEKNYPNLDGCFGIHTKSDIEEGKISAQPGGVMSGFVVYDVTLTGRGGHSSRPDKCLNPMDCFASIYTDMAQMRMRSVSPYECLTNAITWVEGGTKSNIIPDDLHFCGMARFYNAEKAGKPFREELDNIIKKNTEIYDCSYKYGYCIGPTPGLNNHSEMSQIAQKAIRNVLGPESIVEGEPWMASESVAYYYILYPGVFLFLGTENKEKGMGAEHHNSKFDLDSNILYKGVAATVAYAFEFLNEEHEIHFTKPDITIDDLRKTRE